MKIKMFIIAASLSMFCNTMRVAAQTAPSTAAPAEPNRAVDEAEDRSWPRQFQTAEFETQWRNQQTNSKPRWRRTWGRRRSLTMKSMRLPITVAVLVAVQIAPGQYAQSSNDSQASSPQGMVWIAGGEFMMGTNDRDAWNTEKPAHRVKVNGFWMDETEVTNAQFRKFVEATKYKTVAERPLDWEELKKQVPPGTPKPADEDLQPCSLVFVQPERSVSSNDVGQWWKWVDGACWRHPEGPQSNLDGREDHPVVHVAYEDAVAYCKWVGKRLPNEAEWEYAARGGLSQKRFVWGDEDITDASAKCNIWQGEFPSTNTLKDGFLRTAPAKTFSPNGFGLFNVAGNVWEWCSDRYRADRYEREIAVLASPDALISNPKGPADCWDPDDAVPEMPKHVIRGGSFLCHKSYCESYRPSARRGQSPDTSMSHLGFRCVKDAPPAPAPPAAPATPVAPQSPDAATAR